jgi:hypothetical protein
MWRNLLGAVCNPLMMLSKARSESVRSRYQTPVGLGIAAELCVVRDRVMEFSYQQVSRLWFSRSLRRLCLAKVQREMGKGGKRLVLGDWS